MGSLSGWMGNAGVLSLEPRADAMNAQLRIHSTRGASIPQKLSERFLCAKTQFNADTDNKTK